MAFSKIGDTFLSREQRCARHTKAKHTRSVRKLSFIYKDFKKTTDVEEKIEIHRTLFPNAVLTPLFSGISKMKARLISTKAEYQEACKTYLHIKQESSALKRNSTTDNADDAYQYAPSDDREEISVTFQADERVEHISTVEKPTFYVGLPKTYNDSQEIESVVWNNYISGHAEHGANKYEYQFLNGMKYETAKPLEKLQEDNTKITKTPFFTIGLFAKKMMIVLAITFVLLMVADTVNLLNLIGNTWNMGDLERYLFIGIPLACSIGFCMLFLKEIRRWLYSDFSSVWDVPKSLLLTVCMSVTIIIILGFLNADKQQINDQLQNQQAYEQTDDMSFSEDISDTSLDKIEEDPYEAKYAWAHSILYPLLALFLALAAGMFEAFCMVLFHRFGILLKLETIKRRKANLEAEYEEVYLNFNRLPDLNRQIIRLLGTIHTLEDFLVNTPQTEDLDKVFSKDSYVKNIDVILEGLQNGESKNNSINNQKQEQL